MQSDYLLRIEPLDDALDALDALMVDIEPGLCPKISPVVGIQERERPRSKCSSVAAEGFEGS